MAEVVGGKIDLLNLGFTGRLVPFRTLKELGEVRKARGEVNRLKKCYAKLMVVKKNNMRDYIKDHEEGLKHAAESVKFLYELIRNCAYDIHIIKSIIHDMYREDKELEKKAPRIEQQFHLEENVMRTLQQINSNLRKDSDILGALTRQ